jgi:hypothetical protein
MEKANKNKMKSLPFLLICGAMLNFTFWILYYLDVIELTDIEDKLVSSFESAFPAADFVMSIFLILSGIYIIRKRNTGGFFLTIAASMLIYLALLDITFYVSNGYYSKLSSAIILPVCINLLCLTGGTWGLYKSWRIWRVQK